MLNPFKKTNKTLRPLRGFTLMELLVAVAVFSLGIGAAIGLYVSGLRVQRRALAIREISDQTSYIMEYMSKSLRMAKKDLDGVCISSKFNYENPDGDFSKIKFIKYDHDVDKDVCHEFFLQRVEARLYEYKKVLPAGTESTFPLTSEKLVIDSLTFELEGETQQDKLQPRVTISLHIKGKEQSEIKIQTTISQRNLDVQY